MWKELKDQFYDECVDSLSECHFNETMHQFKLSPPEVFAWFKERTNPKHTILPPLNTKPLYHPTAELRWKNVYARSLTNPYTFDVVKQTLQQKWVDVNYGFDEDVPFEWRDVPKADR